MKAAPGAPYQPDPPADTTEPASAVNSSADKGALGILEVLAVQLAQRQSEPELGSPRVDCQGLKLLTSDRPLHWEGFVIQHKLHATQGSTIVDFKFLQDAAVAELTAQGVSGTALHFCRSHVARLRTARLMVLYLALVC